MTFKHAINWFEIPATDLDRAQLFYESIFGIKMIPFEFPTIQMRVFPVEDTATHIGGALCRAGDFYKPSATDGPLIYLNGNPDVQNVLDKVPAAGGTIVIPKTEISADYGYMAVFIDTEGNRIAIHSITNNKDHL